MAFFVKHVGIDRGVGEKAHSVITISRYVREDSAFQILHSQRFDGFLVDPEPQMAEIVRLIKLFPVDRIVTIGEVMAREKIKVLAVNPPIEVHERLEMLLARTGNHIGKRRLILIALKHGLDIYERALDNVEELLRRPKVEFKKGKGNG